MITGSGWQPNEEVTLLFQEDPAVHDDYVLKVQADVGRQHLLEPVGTRGARPRRAVLSDGDGFEVAGTDDVYGWGSRNNRQRELFSS